MILRVPGLSRTSGTASRLPQVYYDPVASPVERFPPSLVLLLLPFLVGCSVCLANLCSICDGRAPVGEGLVMCIGYALGVLLLELRAPPGREGTTKSLPSLDQEERGSPLSTKREAAGPPPASLCNKPGGIDEALGPPVRLTSLFLVNWPDIHAC
jgi:hypothetical protein